MRVDVNYAEKEFYVIGATNCGDLIDILTDVEDWADWSIYTVQEDFYDFDFNDEKYKIMPDDTVNLSTLFVKENLN